VLGKRPLEHFKTANGTIAPTQSVDRWDEGKGARRYPFQPWGVYQGGSIVRFASLGSGSAGNATLIAAADTCLLLDCGFTIKETVRRLANLGVSPESLTGIAVTHEHADHAGGVGPLARRFDLPVWATYGTLAMLRDSDLPRITPIHAHRSLQIGDLEVHPFPVPHDAAEPCQFVFACRDARLGVLTDTGSITAHIVSHLRGCRSLILECNHDADMLRAGPYPPAVQARVASPYGHLGNHQAAELLQKLATDELDTLLLAHISGNNNTPEEALRCVSAALGCAPDWPGVLRQESESDWFEV